MVSIFIGAWVGILFALGSAIGSFLLVVADRHAMGKGFISGRSQCDFCHHPLVWQDLVPFFSYVIHRAKCRYCSRMLPVSYPIFELVSGVLCVAMVLPAILGVESVAQALFIYVTSCIFLILIRIDSVHMLLPDAFLIPVAILIIGHAFAVHADPNSIALGVLSGMGFLYFLWILTGGAGLGFGDVKLMIPLGILFGFQGTVTLLFVAFFIGGLVGIFLLGSGKAHKKTAVPFGPFLLAGAYILILFPGVPDRFFALIGVQ